MTDLPTPARAMAIGAHPDDIEFGAGATLAKWAAQGCAIQHVVCTDGSKGSWDPSEDLASLILTRQDEQRAASRALGGRGDVVFLGAVDGELDSGLDRRRQVADAIRRFRPDVVLGHDPWKRYRLHPDHRHAGYLAIEGIVAARDPHFFPELHVAHHRPATLLLFEADEADHAESAAGYEEAKIAALLAHRSQLRSTMSIDDLHDGEQLQRFRQSVHEALQHPDLAIGPTEVFKRITDL